MYVHDHHADSDNGHVLADEPHAETIAVFRRGTAWLIALNVELMLAGPQLLPFAPNQTGHPDSS